MQCLYVCICTYVHIQSIPTICRMCIYVYISRMCELGGCDTYLQPDPSLAITEDSSHGNFEVDFACGCPGQAVEAPSAG